MVDDEVGKGDLKLFAFEGDDCFFKYPDNWAKSVKVDESWGMIDQRCEELFRIIWAFAALFLQELRKLGDGLRVGVVSLKEFAHLRLI